MTELYDLSSVRKRLMESFLQFSSLEAVKISPNKDEKILNLCMRLYDETYQARRINIDYNPRSELIIDGFVKGFGSSLGDVDLLTIFVSERGLDFSRLWSISNGWLRNHHNEAEIMKAIAN